MNDPVKPTKYPLDRIVCRNLTNLEQNNDYNISVLAINSEGSGPVSQSIVVTTNEASDKNFQLCKSEFVISKLFLTNTLFICTYETIITPVCKRLEYLYKQ